MLDEQTVLRIYNKHGDALYRLCYFYTGNVQDASDAVQNTLIKLWNYNDLFSSEEHEKHWLLKVGVNECRQLHRSWWRTHVELGATLAANTQSAAAFDGLLEDVMALPRKYRLPIYLHYYEGYSTAEISRLLQARESTVRSWMLRGRKLLRQELE